MKEIRAIVSAWKTIDFTTTQAALATVVRVEGSSYRRAGARMLVLDNGTYLGGISGGCLEGDALRRAQKGIALRRPSVITYDTTQDDDYQVGVGLGCEGIIDVLFTPLQPDDAGSPMRILSELTDIRRPEVVVTITGSPDPQWLGKTSLFRDDAGFRAAFPFRDLSDAINTDTSDAITDIADAIITDIRQAQTERLSRSVVHGEMRLFIEVILPAIHLVAYGSNYDIRTLLHQARELGWDSTVVLPASRVDRTRVTAATTVLDSRGSVTPVIDEYTAVLLMSHDYKTDLLHMQRVLPGPASYIGLLGPRKRADRLFDELASTGHPLREADLRRIYAPAGLDIGASTPEEIALSILAEIRSHFSGRQGMSLRQRAGSIYG
ncbi:MAG TPA: XdhC family protein [Puia sp.]|jgi:xanthine dehydrogenase accessory factor|nr:XdhC family protein [Puia sp.]